MNKQLISLISKHNGKRLKFRQLPKEAKYAMAYYMSIDGEAWKYPESLRKTVYKKHGEMLGREVAENITFYTKLYGNKKFGFVNIPTQELLDLFEKEQIAKWFERKKIVEKRKAIWPIILDLNKYTNEDVGIIDDGWTRFGDYVLMKLKSIPCLYYLKNQKYY